MYVCTYTAPSPRVFLTPNQGIVTESLELVCLISISSTTQTGSVNLNWNFASDDDRVTVIPTTITTDDSIGIIYTTMFQFDYLIEEDEGNYTCAVTIDGNSAESTIKLEIMST